MKKFGILLGVVCVLAVASGCKSRGRPINRASLGAAEQKFTFAEKAILALAQEMHFEWSSYYSGIYQVEIDGPYDQVYVDTFFDSLTTRELRGEPPVPSRLNPANSSQESGTDGLSQSLSFSGPSLTFERFFFEPWFDVYDGSRDVYALNGRSLPVLRSRDLRLYCDRMFNLPFDSNARITGRDDFSFCSGQEYDGSYQRRMFVFADHDLQYDIIPTYFDEGNGVFIRGIVARDEYELGEWSIVFDEIGPRPENVWDTYQDGIGYATVSWNAHPVAFPLFGSDRTGYIYNVYR